MHVVSSRWGTGNHGIQRAGQCILFEIYMGLIKYFTWTIWHVCVNGFLLSIKSLQKF